MPLRPYTKYKVFTTNLLFYIIQNLPYQWTVIYSVKECATYPLFFNAYIHNVALIPFCY